jgi:hypothetical protein
MSKQEAFEKETHFHSDECDYYFYDSSRDLTSRYIKIEPEQYWKCFYAWLEQNIEAMQEQINDNKLNVPTMEVIEAELSRKHTEVIKDIFDSVKKVIETIELSKIRSNNYDFTVIQNMLEALKTKYLPKKEENK